MVRANPETPLDIDGDFEINEELVAATGESLSIGDGAASLNIDANGIYIGSDNFADAPFRVDLQGNAFISGLTADGPLIATGITSDAVVTLNNINFTASDIGGIKTTTTGTAPSGAVEGDIWFDSSNGNRLNRYTSGSWVATVDAAIGTAASAASAASSAASAASTAASAAQTTANGKNKITYSTSAPGTTANSVGDIWWQNSGSAIIGQWTGAGGTSWTSNTLSGLVLSSLDAASITTGTLSAGRIAANSLNANVISAGTINSSVVIAGTIAAANITTGTLTTGVLYTGAVAASAITTGTLAASVLYSGTINATQINAGTLTGFTIQTASSGARTTLQSGVLGITMYDGTNSSPASISANSHAVYVMPPSSTSQGNLMAFYGSSYSSSPNRTIILDGSSVRFSVDPTNGVQSFLQTFSMNGLKNIRATSTTSTPSGGSDGDVVLVYTP